MKIDYRAEVDSGYDRKKIVEANIITLLKEGIPVDIIKTSPLFNFNHHEMLRNLRNGYAGKEEQILEIYGGYSNELDEQIVPNRYSEVSHPVGGELYPMTDDEEQKKFKERDDLLAQITYLQKSSAEELKKEQERIMGEILDYKQKYPIIDAIVRATKELDELIAKKGKDSIDLEEYMHIFAKNGLNVNNLKEYEEIYNNYKELKDSLNDITVRYESAQNKKVNTEEIHKLISKSKLIENEIIQRNTKLVNAFIRQKYPTLLVEAEDLFQVCYIAMWEAVKEFDVTKGYKFSTLAYKYMDTAVKQNFKKLIGHKWEDYWTKRKIQLVMKTTSAMLGKNVSVEDLVDYGFLDMSERKISDYLNLAQEYTLSELYQTTPTDYREYEIDSQYETYFGDDGVEDFDNGAIDEMVYYSDNEIFRNLLKENIENVLDTLTPKEHLVLELRFGLKDGQLKNLEEVGQTLGVSRERVRQIEAKALRKLRHPSRSKNLIPLINDDFEPVINPYGSKKR